jgi:hypothetical protein
MDERTKPTAETDDLARNDDLEAPERLLGKTTGFEIDLARAMAEAASGIWRGDRRSWILARRSRIVLMLLMDIL